MSSSRFTLRAYVRNLMDRTLKTSFGTQIVALLLLTAIIASVGTVLASLTLDFATGSEAFWWTWLRITDPGYLGDDNGPWRRVLGTAVIVSGWAVFGLLISILTTAIQERLAELKRGTAAVLSEDHTILLGWNSTIFSVIDQLGYDDEGITGDVVVMADLEVEAMQEAVDKYCRPGRPKRLSFRRGSIESIRNVLNLNIGEAKQVIVLGYDRRELDDDLHMDTEEAERHAELLDSHVLKSLLACYQALLESPRDKAKGRLAVVASVRSAHSAAIIRNGLPPAVKECMFLHVIDTPDFLSRLTAQSANQPGLALVYQELFSYGGNQVSDVDISSEIYCVPVPEDMVGVSFEDCLMGFPEAIPIGYLDGPKLVLNPRTGSDSARYTFAAGDRIVAVADTKQQIEWGGRAPFQEERVDSTEDLPPQTVLLLGTGSKARKVLERLPQCLPPGSKVRTDQPTDGIDPHHCTFEPLDLKGSKRERTTKRLTSTDAVRLSGSFDWKLVDTVVLVDDHIDRDRHDARILMTLTALQYKTSIPARSGAFLVELLDYRNLELIKSYGDPVAIISSELVSNFLVQLAEEPQRGPVYEQLLDPKGSELRLHSVDLYTRDGETELSFEDLAKRAWVNGVIAIGFLPGGAKPLQLSPAERTKKRALAEFGDLVVLSEH